MFKVKSVSCFILMVIAFHNGYADELTGSALQKTQDCLRSQNCESMGTDNGKAADQKALAAVGGNASSKQALYSLSAEIMPILERQAEGDPAKIEALLMKAQNDPEGFINSLPPDIKAQINTIAGGVK